MAKIKWNRIAEKNLIRKHGHEVVEREYTQKVRKANSLSSQIDLKDHEEHDWQPIISPPGSTHAGKIVCNTCNGKWVTWLSKDHVKAILKTN